MNARIPTARQVSVEEAMLIHEWVRSAPLPVRHFDSEPWSTVKPYLLTSQPCSGPDSELFYRVYDGKGAVLCSWKTHRSCFSKLVSRALVALQRLAIEEATGPATKQTPSRSRL